MTSSGNPVTGRVVLDESVDRLGPLSVVGCDKWWKKAARKKGAR
jgi:hypothetical protein